MPLVWALFFISGAAGLVYEVIWMRQLALVFGTTADAVTAVLVAFMGGLALGGWLVGRIGDRVRSPLALYGLLELGVGLYAFAIPLLFDALVPVYQWLATRAGAGSSLLTVIRFVLAVAVLLVPTTMMGGTLPVLARWAARRREAVGRQTGLLYAVNTWGAVLGVAGAGFVMLPAFGMARTTTVAVVANLIAGVIALGLSRLETHPAAGPETAKALQTAAGGKAGLTAGVVAVFALSGFVALVCEVAWTRLLTLIIGSSTYAFTLMLTAFLVGLAGGSLTASLILGRFAAPRRALAVCQIGIGLGVFFGEFLFARLPLLFLALFQAAHGSIRLLHAGMFSLSLGVMLVPTLLMGAVFPLVLRLASGAGPHGLSRLVGRAYAVNTLGAIGGAVAAGFVLIPWLGIQHSLTLAAGLAVAAGLVLIWTETDWPRRRLAAGLAAGGLLVILVAAPRWSSAVMTLGVHKDAPLFLSIYRSPDEALRALKGYRELFYREGRTATVSVREQPSLDPLPHLTLSIDGKVDASTAGDMATQVLSGHLPLLMAPRPASGDERVLVIGLASGITAGAVLTHPVREVVAVEIEPAMAAASHLFDDFNHRPLADPRLRLIVEDARNTLLTTGGLFDVIISEPSNPWMSGPAKLFTLEFFRIGRARLAPDGVFVQWLQLYGMRPEHLQALIRTFRAVFPSVLIFQTGESDLLMIGSAQRLHLDLAGMDRLLASRPAAVADLARVRVRDAFDVSVRLLLGPDEVAGFAGSGPLNTDDNALIEFAAPRSLYLDTVALNLGELRLASKGIAEALTWAGLTPDEQAAALLTVADRVLSAPAPAAPRQTSADGLIEQARGLISLPSLTSLPAPSPSQGEGGRGKEGGVRARIAARADWLTGRLALSRDQEAEAVAAWRLALSRDPSSDEARLALARFYYERAQYREAERFSRRLEPGRADGLHGLTLYHLGRSRDAVASLAVALSPPRSPAAGRSRDPRDRQDPQDPTAEINRLGEQAEFRFYLAQAYDQLHRRAEARATREALLQDLEVWRVALERTPRAYPLLKFRRLLEFHQAQGITSAEEAELARLFTTHVADPLVHFYSGVGLYLLGYDETAVRELEAALRGLPHDNPTSLIHLYLGLTSYRLGRSPMHEDVVGHLEPFLKARGAPDSRQIEAARVLAEIYTAHGHPEEAEKVRAAMLDIHRRLFTP